MYCHKFNAYPNGTLSQNPAQWRSIPGYFEMALRSAFTTPVPMWT